MGLGSKIRHFDVVLGLGLVIKIKLPSSVSGQIEALLVPMVLSGRKVVFLVRIGGGFLVLGGQLE